MNEEMNEVIGCATKPIDDKEDVGKVFLVYDSKSETNDGYDYIGSKYLTTSQIEKTWDIDKLIEALHEIKNSVDFDYDKSEIEFKVNDWDDQSYISFNFYSKMTEEEVVEFEIVKKQEEHRKYTKFLEIEENFED